MNMKIGITTAMIAIASMTGQSVIASSDVPEDNAESCYDAGFDDGEKGPFNEATWDHCGDEEGGDDAYYDGFIDGCMSVEGNTRDVCESATDAG
jgi:hypothetical protein